MFSAKRHYVVAGMRVTVNQTVSDLACNGFFDSSVDITVRETPRVDGYLHETQESFVWNFGPGSIVELDADGSSAMILTNEAVAEDCGAVVRNVVPFASALQGKHVLHASAVSDGESVIAFVGASGVGKSTLARQLQKRGYLLVADDLLPCRIVDGRIMVPVVGNGLRGCREAYLPFGAIFFPERASVVDHMLFDKLSSQHFLRALTYNGFGELMSADIWRMQFETNTKLAEKTPAWKITLPDSLDQLSESVDELVRFYELQSGHRTPSL